VHRWVRSKNPGCHTNVHNFHKLIAPPVLPRLKNGEAHDILQALLSIVGFSKLIYSECWLRYKCWRWVVEIPSALARQGVPHHSVVAEAKVGVVVNAGAKLSAAAK
jgi:hypothetical protein